MKFKLFQKYNRKIGIWSGATALFITLLILLILWAIPLASGRDKVMIGVQIVLNEFLIWLFLGLSNRSRTWIQFLLEVNVYRRKKQLRLVTLSLNPRIHFYLFLFLSLLWLVETSTFVLWTNSWLEAIHRYWWVTLIFLGINYLYLLIFWLSQIYLYNRDPQILNALRNPHHRN